MAVNRVRRNGSYAPLSAHYYKDDAIDEAGEAAELLYVRGLAFCADVLSDGFISDRQLVRFVGVGMFDAAERAQRLVEVGLWDREGGGYQVRSWLSWNRSKAEITESMAKDRARKGGGSTPAPAVTESERPDPDPPRGGGHDADRIPNGIPPDSETPSDGSPAGFPPRARTPLHSTPLQDTTDKDSAAADAADPEPPAELELETPPPTDPRPGFDEFWKLYPNKVKKQPAIQSWDRYVVKARVPPDLVLDALRRQIVSWQAEPQYPRFVPHPPTWLNNRRWNDEPADRPLRAVSGGHQPWRNPTDPDAYDQPLLTQRETW